jgi:hypothetical protein
LEVEFLLGIPTIFGLRLKIFLARVTRHLLMQIFSRPSTKYIFFCWRCGHPSSVRASNKKIYIQKLKEN